MPRKALMILAGCACLSILLGGCTLPDFSSPTPFVFPTPNLTMTALFQPTATLPPTLTPPPVQTATSPPASPTPETQPPATAIPLPTASQNERARPGEGVVAAFLASPPAVDGDLGDWQLAAQPVESVVYGPANVSGAQDLSGDVYVAWDEQFLYLGVRVVDETYAQGASGDDLYLGDSVEVLIDTRLSDDFFVADLSPDDFQLGVSPGSPSPGDNPEAYLWYPRSVEGARAQVEIAAQATADGYQVEMAVPWGVFEISAQAGQRYGFAFSISDNDNTAADVQESMVSSVATRRLTNPTTWGNLFLAAP